MLGQVAVSRRAPGRVAVVLPGDLLKLHWRVCSMIRGATEFGASLYLVVLLALGVCSLASLEPRLRRLLYWMCFFGLTAMLALRYGQGTDWFAYNYLYSLAPNTIDFGANYYSADVHAEWGWKLINNVLKSSGASFTVLTVSLSLIEMVCLHRSIRLFGKKTPLTLLISYPTIYLTYFFSALRQGVVLAVFLGIMLPLYKERKPLYVLVALLLCQIHAVSIILLLPLLFDRVSDKSLGVFLAASFIIGTTSFLWLESFVRLIGLSYSFVHPSPLAFLYRMSMSLVVFFLYQAKRTRAVSGEDGDRDVRLLLRFYVLGLVIYLAFLSNSLMASRLAIMFMAVEIALIPKLMPDSLSPQVVVLSLLVVAMTATMTTKNIDSYISQGGYYPFVHIETYPYVTIFNQSDIYFYRSDRYIAFIQ